MSNDRRYEQENVAEDSLNEVVMAVDLRDRGTVGCCYYVARDEKLYFMEDVKCGGWEVIESCECLKIGCNSAILTDIVLQ